MTEHSPDYIKGWEAALDSVRHWLHAQAKQALVQSGRTRFPKNLEREAEVYNRAADRIGDLSPYDV